MPLFAAFLYNLVISVALFALAELLRPKPDIENARPSGLGDFRFATATEGRCLPLIWGTVPISGPNIIWYGDLKLDKITEKIKSGMFSSKKVTTGFRYNVGIAFAICHGKIDGITKIVYDNKYVLYNGAATLSDIVFQDRGLFGTGPGGNGGLDLRFVIHDGTQTTTDPYMLNKLGATRLPAYTGTAYLVMKHPDGSTMQGAYVGDSARLGQVVFHTRRIPDNLGLTGTHHIVNSQDANPMEVIYEILTDADWGLGFSSADINLVNFKAVGEIMFTEGNGFSFMLDQAKPPAEIIGEIERQINGRLYIDQITGQFNMKLARADYDVNTILQLDESNIVDLKHFVRGDWSSTSNEVRVPFEDSSQDFRATYSIAQDGANYETQGLRKMATIRFPGCKNKQLASDLAWRELRALSFPLAQATVSVNRTAFGLNPADPVAYSWADYGILKMPMRISRVDYGKLDDGVITLDLIQDVFKTDASAFSAPPATEFVAPTQLVTPFAALDQWAEETPLLALKQLDGAEGLTYTVWCHARDAGNAYRYEIRRKISTDGTYTSEGYDVSGLGIVGVIRTPGLVGFTTAMPAQGSGTVIVDNLDDVTALITAGLIADSDTNTNFTGVCVIEPGTANEEFVIFRRIVANGAGVELQQCIRGALDSAPRAHATGTRVWFIGDASPNLVDEQFLANNTVNVKLMPESPTDEVTESEAITINVSMPAAGLYRAGKPYPPNELALSAVTRPATLNLDTAGLVVTWTRRPYSNANVVENALGQDDAGSTGWSNITENNLQWNWWLYDLQSNPTPANRAAAFLNGTVAAGASNNGFTVTRDALFAAAAIVPTSVRIEVESFHDAPGATSDNVARQVLNYDQVAITSDLQTPAAIDLNGTDEYAANTTAVALGIANSWSLEMWVHPDTTGVAARFFLSLTNAGLGGNDGIVLDLPSDASAAEFRIRTWNSASGVLKNYGFGSYTPNAWTQLFATWNGTTLLVYQNATNDATPTLTADNAGSMSTGTRRVIMGVEPALLTTGHLDGLVGRVAMWNAVLSGAEITALYNAGDSDGVEPRKNFGSYTHATSLQHCWDWREIANVGRDYGFGTAIDVDTNASNLTSADLVTGP